MPLLDEVDVVVIVTGFAERLRGSLSLKALTKPWYTTLSGLPKRFCRPCNFLTPAF
jgi:hypothetical protein